MCVHALLRSLKRVAITRAIEQAKASTVDRSVNFWGKPHSSISKRERACTRTCGRGTILRERFPGVCYLESIRIEKSCWEHDSCPLSRIEKRPLLGGYVSIKVMLDTIRNTTVVRCRQAVLFSEGPLSEARLYVVVAGG